MRHSLSMAILIAILPVSCRIAKVGKDYSDHDIQSGGGDAIKSTPPVVQPQQQAASGISVNIHLDSSGKIQEAMTLRLDYFPPPRPDGVSLPTCYDEISGHLVIGRLYCGANGNISADLTAAQVTQQCFTVTPSRKIEPKSPALLPGCVGDAVLKLYKFEPDVKLEIRALEK